MAIRSGVLQGASECRDSLRELSRGVRKGVGNRALKIPGAIIARAIEARAAVSTRPSDPTPGSLKAAPKVVSAKAKRGQSAVAVLVDDEAAVRKEYGLSHKDYPADPFARPAIATALPAAGFALVEAVKVAAGKAAERAARRAAKRALAG